MAVIVLYPCSQFDYLASERTEEEAKQLFEHWAAAHHPAVLDGETQMPRWETASWAPFNLQNDTVLVPPCCEAFWSEDWDKQTADCTVIRNSTDRHDIVTKILASRRTGEEAPYVPNSGLVADCEAAAAGRFLLALLERNMHYMQMPDEQRLHDLFAEMILASKSGVQEIVDRTVREAVCEIAQAKDNYYQTQNYFIELILVTKTTAGEPLYHLLQKKEKVNLFMPTAVLKEMPAAFPETFQLLKTAAEQKNVCLIADETEEAGDTLPSALALLPILDAADRLLAGITVHRELLNTSPKFYGKLTAGLSPMLPQLLKLTDFKGAIHFAPLDGWKIKEEEQSKIIWQGDDHTLVDALLRYPIDASRYLGFFELAEQLGSHSDSDQTLTAVFATFPGQESGWLEPLRRFASYHSGLGKFADLEEFFSDTVYSGSAVNYGYEKYPVQALTAAESAPISSWNLLYQKSVNRLTHAAFKTLLTLLRKPVSDAPLAEQFAQTILQNVQSGGHKPAVPPAGSFAVNPLSFPIRIFIDDKPVTVPPMGYAYAASAPAPPPQTKKRFGFFAAKSEPVLARKGEDDIGKGEKRPVYLLENRYFSAKFDAVTGVLRSVFTNRSRYNQLSRQLSFRNKNGYSISAADEIVILKSTPEIGQLKMTGRLVNPDGETAARFIETIIVRSESRMLEFELTLEPLTEPDDDRRNSYFAVRYAWNDDTLEMRGGLNDGLHVLPDTAVVHAPLSVDLRNDKESLTFFSEGLPFHRRSGPRQLDTLLIVKGEPQRTFRFGIGINQPQPFFAVYEFLLQKDTLVFPAEKPPAAPSSWLFQIESQSVFALHWEHSETLTVYLKNAEPRRAHFALRSFLLPKKASAVSFHGEEIKPLKIDGDAVLIDMHRFELLPVRIEF